MVPSLVYSVLPLCRRTSAGKTLVFRVGQRRIGDHGNQYRIEGVAPPLAVFLALLSLGLGAYLGWQSVGISPTLFPQPHEGIDMVLRQGLVAQNALFLALLALFAYGAYRKGGLVAHKPLIVGIGTLMCAGTALTYACGWVGNAPAGCVRRHRDRSRQGLGYIALWGEALGRVRFRNALLCISVAYATMFALCLLVQGACRCPRLIVHAVLPRFRAARCWCSTATTSSPTRRRRPPRSIFPCACSWALASSAPSSR